jgi:hypothetical protein
MCRLFAHGNSCVVVGIVDGSDEVVIKGYESGRYVNRPSVQVVVQDKDCPSHLIAEVITSIILNENNG